MKKPIGYNGTIKELSLIPEMVEEVEDICKTLEWKYVVEDFKLDLPPRLNKILGLEKGERLEAKGVTFRPHLECDWVRLIVVTNTGKLFLPYMDGVMMEINKPLDSSLVQCMTFYAGPEIHMSVMDLLGYLSEKYFNEFEVEDFTNYWQTKNKEKATQAFVDAGWKLEEEDGGQVNEERINREKLGTALKHLIDFIQKLKDSRNKDDEDNEDEDDGEEWKRLLE